MKFNVNLIFITFISLISHYAIAGNTEIPIGIFEYVYEYNTENQIENHYIKISIKNGNIHGEYYGTSDDFDNAREGYLPGYFTAQMMNIQTKGKNISFSIKPSKYFKNPITPISKTINNIPWDIPIKSTKRTYKGTYSDKKLIINSNGLDPRTFIKIK